MNEPGWEMQQVNEERHRSTIDALKRCVEAGVDTNTIKTLAHECGVDLNYIVIDKRKAA